MVDIHAHILPGVDDGSDRTLTSLYMAEMAARSGVTDLIATPHSNQRGRFENYASPELTARFEKLKAAVAAEKIPLRLHLGMEVYATSDAPELYREGKLLTLASSRYFLVEFGVHDDVYYIQHVLRDLQDAGVTPILAHPERYQTVQALPNILYDWVMGGVHLQINKGSLAGRFGKAPFQTAVLMLSHDLASFVASDAHRADQRTPVLDETFHWLAANFSENRAHRLLSDNPKRVLQNRPLLPCRPVPFA